MFYLQDHSKSNFKGDAFPSTFRSPELQRVSRKRDFIRLSSKMNRNSTFYFDFLQSRGGFSLPLSVGVASLSVDSLSPRHLDLEPSGDWRGVWVSINGRGEGTQSWSIERGYCDGMSRTQRDRVERTVKDGSRRYLTDLGDRHRIRIYFGGIGRVTDPVTLTSYLPTP